MPNVLTSGFQFLRDALHAYASEPVRVERGGETILTSTVVYGATKRDETDKAGRRSFAYVDDLIFRGDVDYVPTNADVFFVGDPYVANGVLRYVTRSVGGEIYRWEDSARTQLRVHVMRKEAPAVS